MRILGYLTALHYIRNHINKIVLISKNANWGRNPQDVIHVGTPVQFSSSERKCCCGGGNTKNCFIAGRILNAN